MAFRVLDGKKLAFGSAQDKVDFCEALVDGFSQQGLVKLVNHGISDSDIEKAFEWVRNGCSWQTHGLTGGTEQAVL